MISKLLGDANWLLLFHVHPGVGVHGIERSLCQLINEVNATAPVRSSAYEAVMRQFHCMVHRLCYLNRPVVVVIAVNAIYYLRV